MEPTDLNSSDPADEKLAAFLRSAEGPPLDDDGFSTRVLAALPPPPRPVPLFARRDWIMGSAIVILLLLLTPLGLSSGLTATADQAGDALLNLFSSLMEDTTAIIVIGVVVVALLLTEREEDISSEWSPE